MPRTGYHDGRQLSRADTLRDRLRNTSRTPTARSVAEDNYLQRSTPAYRKAVMSGTHQHTR